MKTLMFIAFIAALIGLLISMVALYKLVHAKKTHPYNELNTLTHNAIKVE